MNRRSSSGRGDLGSKIDTYLMKPVHRRKMSHNVTSTNPHLDTDFTDVPASLFRRHLGLPACADLDERILALANGAQRWYRQNGTPWVHMRSVEIERIEKHVVRLRGGAECSSGILAEGLQRAGAHAVLVLAMSAGPEVDQHIDRLWNQQRPDKAMFANAYAIAVTENLRFRTISTLRDQLQRQGETALPLYSPGFEGWDLSDQHSLYDLIAGLDSTGAPALPGPLTVLSSGGLRPAKSILALTGVTRQPVRNASIHDSFTRWATSTSTDSIENDAAGYALPVRTLQRWMRDRLTLIRHDRRIAATFRLDGSTCTNMGTPLAFDYRVELFGENQNTYRITACSCRPAPDDQGHRATCAYLDAAHKFMAQLKSPPPFLGCTLDQALDWQGTVSPSACLCTRADRDHKWRIVLQTIHYALASCPQRSNTEREASA